MRYAVIAFLAAVVFVLIFSFVFDFVKQVLSVLNSAENKEIGMRDFETVFNKASVKAAEQISNLTIGKKEKPTPCGSDEALSCTAKPDTEQCEEASVPSDTMQEASPPRDDMKEICEKCRKRRYEHMKEAEKNKRRAKRYLM